MPIGDCCWKGFVQLFGAAHTLSGQTHCLGIGWGSWCILQNFFCANGAKFSNVAYARMISNVEAYIRQFRVSSSTPCRPRYLFTAKQERDSKMVQLTENNSELFRVKSPKTNKMLVRMCCTTVITLQPFFQGGL